MTMLPILLTLGEILILILPILLGIAFSTICERKTMAYMQRRLGPNYVGFGLLQPFADAAKLLIKELIIPSSANKFLFFLGPMLALIFALFNWAVIPLNTGLTLSDMKLGLLFTLAVSSLASYGILIAGWASNSKYPFFGAIRSTAQMISYELILSSVVIILAIINGNLNYTSLINSQTTIWFIFAFLPLFFLFFIAALAESNRPPMDLVEAESELTGGFMTEHSGSIFVFFFLAEYSALVFLSCFTAILFLGGYLLPEFLINNFISFDAHNLTNNILAATSLSSKTCLIIFLFIWIRASFPRFRFDQLIYLCWTVLLPAAFAFILMIPCFLHLADIIPYNV